MASSGNYSTGGSPGQISTGALYPSLPPVQIVASGAGSTTSAGQTSGAGLGGLLSSLPWYAWAAISAGLVVIAIVRAK